MRAVFAACLALPLSGCLQFGPGVPDPTVLAQPCPVLKRYDQATLDKFAVEVSAISKTAPTVVSFLGDYRGLRKECGAE